MKGLSFILIIVLLCPILVTAQRIVYSEPQQEDSRNTNFDIIGKVNGNILVFKNNRSRSSLAAYDGDLKLIKEVNLDFLPQKYINVDFIQYPGYFYMFYEYQHRNIVYCKAVKMDGEGNRLGEPEEIDTTLINFAANNKIYTTISSEDKQHIMVFKINSKNPHNYLFTTFLFDKNLNSIDRHRVYMPMEEKNDMFNSFLLDNDGQMIFGKYLKNSGTNEFISKVSLVTKGPQADTFSIKDIGSNDRVLDEIKIKVDNENKRYILTGFYYKQKKGNIEGLYSVLWDKATDSKIKETVTVFNDELRSQAKSSDANSKMAFNDFFIKNVIVEKDGGYLVVSECEYTTSRGVPFNRWDYMYGYNPMYSPMDYYYSPFYNPYSPWNRYGYGNMATRYDAENILVLSFDKESNMEWNTVIPKSQYDDQTPYVISHHIMNTGGEIHFLFNQDERRARLLTDLGVSPEGKLTRYPTLRNLDRGYDFMPRNGKQISSNEILIPCFYRNYLCFAKIDY
jgi:hypothetical protein